MRRDDGRKITPTFIDDFDREIVRTRRNAKLLSLLDERAAQTRTIPLAVVEQQLGLND